MEGLIGFGRVVNSVLTELLLHRWMQVGRGLSSQDIVAGMKSGHNMQSLLD